MYKLYIDNFIRINLYMVLVQKPSLGDNCGHCCLEEISALVKVPTEAAEATKECRERGCLG